MPTNEAIQEKFEGELKQMASNRSLPNFFNDPGKVKKVGPSYAIKNVSLSRITIRPSVLAYAYYVGFILFAISVPVFMASKISSYALILFSFCLFLPFALLAGFKSVEHLNKKFVLNQQGILADDGFTAWNDIIGCYIMETPYGRTTKSFLMILLTNGDYKEYELGAISPADFSHYVFKFKEDYQARFSKANAGRLTGV